MADAKISDAELKEILDANKAMMKRIEELSVNNGEQTRTLKRVTERKVEIRMVDDKAVVGYHNRGTLNRPTYVYAKQDPANPTQQINFIDLITEGMKEGEYITVQDREFRRETERVKCKVVKVEEQEWILNQGTVRKRAVEEYSMVEQDYEVPVEIVGKTRWFVVELPVERGARRLKVHESMVNIG